MAQKEQVKGFFNNLLAGAVWDGVKLLWGPTVLAAIVGMWQKLKHGSLDWAAIDGMFVVATILAFLNFRRIGIPSENQNGRWKPKWQKLQWANTERERLEVEVRELKEKCAAESAQKNNFQKEMEEYKGRFFAIEGDYLKNLRERVWVLNKRGEFYLTPGADPYIDVITELRKWHGF
jgi:hypothetical protein